MLSKRGGRNIYFTPQKKAEIRRKYYGTTKPQTIIARVVGDDPSAGIDYFRRSKIKQYAAANKLNMTKAEQKLSRILFDINSGALRGKYKLQYPISGKWIVDFYFPEIRLAIEVDGGIHSTREQRAKDIQKDQDCRRFDITVLRLSNSEVFGLREHLVAKLRQGWRSALDRKCILIGSSVALQT